MLNNYVCICLYALNKKDLENTEIILKFHRFNVFDMTIENYRKLSKALSTTINGFEKTLIDYRCRRLSIVAQL